jgi:hypothetical protein
MAKRVREQVIVKKVLTSQKNMSGDKFSPCDIEIIKSIMGWACGTHGKQDKCK